MLKSVVFPDPEGPLATLRWEAIREGIDDFKLIYQLEQRIQDLNKVGLDISAYSNFLLNLKKKQSKPDLTFQRTNDWDQAFFESARRKIISFILDANNKLAEKGSTCIE